MLAVIHVDGLRLPAVHERLAQGVLDDIHFLVRVKLRVHHEPRGVVNPGGHIGLHHLAIRPDGQVRTVLDVALIQLAAIRLLETACRRALPAVHVDLLGAEAPFLQMPLQCAAVDRARLDLSLQLKDVDDAARRALPAPALHGGLLCHAGIQILPIDHALDYRSPVVLVGHNEIRQHRVQATALWAKPARHQQLETLATLHGDVALTMVVAAQGAVAVGTDRLLFILAGK